MDLSGFNAENYDELADFDTLPKGWYLCEIVKTERPEKKDYMNIEFTIIDGQFKGRKVWDMCHLWNEGAKKQKTIEMAQRQLATICKHINVPKPNDSSDMHGIPIGIKIGHETYLDQLKERIKGYCSEKDFSAKAATNVGTATSEAPNSETGKSTPW